MNRDDIHKLLGGYATGTLTPEEQQVLFEAALDDQELFDALAREQALHDLLRDPASKAHLLAALDQKPLRWYQRLTQNWRPLVAVAAMAGVGAIVVGVWQGQRSAKPVLVAKLNEPPPAGPAVSVPPASANQAMPSTPLPRQAQPEPSNPSPTAKESPAKESPAKDSPAKVAPPRERVPEEDRRSFEKQAAEPKQKDLAGTPVPAARPASPGDLGYGFRPGASGGGVSRQQIAPSPSTAAAPPPPPPAMQAPPRAETQSAQTLMPLQAPSQQAQQGGQQGQAISGRAQMDPGRLSQPPAPKPESVQVQAESALVDAVTSRDAKSLFYGTDSDQLAGGTSNARGGVSSVNGFGAARNTLSTGARKKAEAPAKPATVNKVGATSQSAQPGVLNLGVRYNLLRRTSTGAFEQMDPGSLKTGDIVELQLMPNDGGTLIVRARGADGALRDVMLRSVEPRQSYITQPLTPGTKEVQVMLIRFPSQVVATALRDDKSDVSQQATTEPATYVVGSAASRQLQFTIPLKYQ